MNLFYLDYVTSARVTNMAAWSVLNLLEAPPAHCRFGAVASNAKILPQGEDLREPTVPEGVEADGGLTLSGALGPVPLRALRRSGLAFLALVLVSPFDLRRQSIRESR